MKPRIALFDFDGTITRKDSLLEFIRYTRGSARFYMGFILLSPLLVAMKARLLSNQQGKEFVLRYFFGGTPKAVFDSWCQEFAHSRIPSIIRPGALDKIRRLKQDNIAVVLVSASPENWLQNWTKSNDIQLIGTRLVIKDERITGFIKGKNCHGIEKVRRIRENFPQNEYEITDAFGDTKGDLPMLELAANRHWKPFR